MQGVERNGAGSPGSNSGAQWAGAGGAEPQSLVKLADGPHTAHLACGDKRLNTTGVREQRVSRMYFIVSSVLIITLLCNLLQTFLWMFGSVELLAQILPSVLAPFK